MRIGLTLVLIGLWGVLNTTSSYASHPDDPFEPFNRIAYRFNTTLDQHLLRPIAVIYDAWIPQAAKKGVLNICANMGEVPAMANDLLQGHPIHALSDLTRFGINSTIGVAGIFDIATHWSLQRRYNDFGITLAKWGIRHSPYLVIPFIGPSTFRDGAGLLVNLRYLTLWPYLTPIPLRNNLFALDIVSLRTTFLDAEDIMHEAALDPYVFIRNAYLQKRASLMNEDNPENVSTDSLDLDFGLDAGEE